MFSISIPANLLENELDVGIISYSCLNLSTGQLIYGHTGNASQTL